MVLQYFDRLVVSSANTEFTRLSRGTICYKKRSGRHVVSSPMKPFLVRTIALPIEAGCAHPIHPTVAKTSSALSRRSGAEYFAEIGQRPAGSERTDPRDGNDGALSRQAVIAYSILPLGHQAMLSNQILARFCSSHV